MSGQQIWCVWVRCHQHDIPDLQSSTMNIYEFTAGDAWVSFCSAHPPSKFGTADLFVFKRDAIPAREACVDGGQWGIEINSLPWGQLDILWFRAIQALTGGEFEDPSSSCLSGMALSCRTCSVGLQLWMSEYSEAEAESIGAAFHKFLTDFGRSECLTFERFGTGADALHTTPCADASAMNDDVRTVPPSFQVCKEMQETRDTGQWSIGHPHCTIIVMPGFNEADGTQLLLKNSFIHAVSAIDEVLPVPTLQRMRTA